MNNSFAEQIATIRTQLTSPGAPFELVEEQVTGETVKMFRNAFPTLPDFINAGREHGNATFMVYRGTSWSFNQFYQHADTLAAKFQSLGVKPGDRVAIAMRNRPEWGVAFVAAVLVGAVPAPLNSFELEQELRASLKDLEPAVLCCDNDRLECIKGDTGLANCHLILVGKEHAKIPAPKLERYNDIVTQKNSPQPVTVQPDDPALILLTSGASSRAKGVLSTHRAVCQALFGIDYIGAISAMSSPEAVAIMMESGLQPTTLTVVPLFHISGLHAQLLTALRHGRRLVIMYKWNPEEALELIQSENVTQFNGAPSMVAQLIKEPGFEDPEITGSLSALGFGGAGLSQKLINDVLDKRPNGMCGIGFGLTETNGMGAAGSGRIFSYKANSCGIPSPVIDTRIVDDHDKPLGVNEQGEICFRGVTLMDGYWRNEEATRIAKKDGWFHTGDVGYIDDEGFLFVVDRIKDVINRAGEKIASAEIESCLSEIPEIAEVAVFSLPSVQTDESVAAAVVLNKGSTITADNIKNIVGERLASYKKPEHVFFRSNPLPRNPAGKVLKPELKKEYLNH